MPESIKMAGRELIPIAAGYEPHAYVFAAEALTYRVTPVRHGDGYTLRCLTAEWEAVFETLEAAVEHVNQQENARVRPKRRHWRRATLPRRARRL
jgi:hypothetical protein